MAHRKELILIKAAKSGAEETRVKAQHGKGKSHLPPVSHRCGHLWVRAAVGQGGCGSGPPGRFPSPGLLAAGKDLTGSSLLFFSGPGLCVSATSPSSPPTPQPVPLLRVHCAVCSQSPPAITTKFFPSHVPREKLRSAYGVWSPPGHMERCILFLPLLLPLFLSFLLLSSSSPSHLPPTSLSSSSLFSAPPLPRTCRLLVLGGLCSIEINISIGWM